MKQVQVDRDLWWQAVLARNRAFDGLFVYAVKSTGIYCLPSCPSRRPARTKVTFFPSPEVAEQAGYRPCRRCRPNRSEISDPQTAMVQRACRLIETHDQDGAMTLEVLAARFGISSYHFQRTFKRIMGITPRQYAEAARINRLKKLFKEGQDVTTALYEAGYNSSSRLYENAAIRLGMTPATYLRGGKGMNIEYAICDSPLGRLLVATTNKGICAVSLGDSDTDLNAALIAEYPEAKISRSDRHLKKLIEVLLAHLSGYQPTIDLPMDLQVTAFQWKVYEILSTIPYGEITTYQQIAETLGRPKAARAVGHACARNPLAFVIPCHRVVRKDGELGGYRWGLERKKRLLRREKEASSCQNKTTDNTTVCDP